jgi:hypothetical protein
MNWKDYNVFRIVLSLVLTAAFLFCGQALWHNYAVAKPLDKTLQEINGVEQVTLHKKSKLDDTVTIDVTLKNAANFATTYKQISDTAKQILGQNQVQIKINDHRTPDLEQLYYDVHFYLQEAIATGSFALMNERIQQTATEHGAAANIYVNTDTIYVKLAKGEAELYMLIPRPNHVEEAKNNAL